MNRHRQCNELLTAFVLGELDDRQAAQVREHLADCQECTQEVRRIEALLTQTERLRGLSVDESMCVSAGQQVLSAAEPNRYNGHSKGFESPVVLIWRIIMKNGFTKVAVAAAVVLAAFLGLRLFTGDGSGKLYANVVKMLHNARTMTYSVVARTGVESMQTIRVDIAFKEPHSYGLHSRWIHHGAGRYSGQGQGHQPRAGHQELRPLEMINIPDDPARTRG